MWTERISPSLDEGRYPVKRSLGESLEIGADILIDGHGSIAAEAVLQPPGETQWLRVPLEYRYDPDRWFGSLVLDRLGVWRFTVEAWPDRWQSFRQDLEKWAAAGEPLEGELAAGAELLRIRARRLRGGPSKQLLDAARRLVDPSLSAEERLAVALDGELARAMSGPLREEERSRHPVVYEVVVDRERARFGAWYELFPRSQTSDPGRHGTFADVEKRLPELAELGFDVLYFPPIHPIGRTNRKGRNNSRTAGPGDPGSPWAIGSEEGGHTAVHPELGTLEDFEALVGRARDHGLEIALDYALQCSPDHPWVREHPDWFFVRPDGSIRYAENPPKRYEDVVPLNFWCRDREALWRACLEILLFWMERGVRIFRVDNPHTKPFAFWSWLIPELRARNPEVVLLSEAFTRPKRMKLLAKLGFSQSYTYFTWKVSTWELREYLTELTTGEMPEYFRPNFFTNTPDILHEYLQKGGRPAFRVRLLLAATLSPSYGIYSGFELCENVPLREGSEEYLNSEKYEIRVRDWDAPGNIKDEIRTLNRIRRERPALQVLTNLSFLPSENDQILWYRKSHPEGDLFVAVNLDPHHVQETLVELPLHALGWGESESLVAEDLLSGERYVWQGRKNYVRLDPAERVGHVLVVRPARSEA